VIPLNTKDEEVMQTAERYYEELKAAGVDVLFDDRNARAGVKFNDADLIGIPYRIVIGGKGLKNGEIETKWRTADQAEMVALDAGITPILEALEERKAAEIQAANVPE